MLTNNLGFRVAISGSCKLEVSQCLLLAFGSFAADIFYRASDKRPRRAKAWASRAGAGAWSRIAALGEAAGRPFQITIPKAGPGEGLRLTNCATPYRCS